MKGGDDNKLEGSTELEIRAGISGKINFPSALDSLNMTSPHTLQTPHKISNHTSYTGRRGGKHSRTEMCAWKEWHGEFSTDLSGETS